MDPMSQAPRPPQATTSVLIVVISSVFLVVGAFDGINSVHSIATTEMLARTYADPVFKQLGFTVEHAALLTELAWMLTAAAAAACFVLAWYIPKRHRAARIVLTLCALPALAMVPFTGSVMPFMLAVGAGIMWTQPMREWFAAPVADEGPR